MSKMDDPEQWICPECGAELVPGECWVCGGDGMIPGDEFDPINYSPWEEVECSSCGGTGEMGLVCPFCEEGSDR